MDSFLAHPGPAHALTPAAPGPDKGPKTSGVSETRSCQKAPVETWRVASVTDVTPCSAEPSLTFTTTPSRQAGWYQMYEIPQKEMPKWGWEYGLTGVTSQARMKDVLQKDLVSVGGAHTDEEEPFICKHLTKLTDRNPK